MLRKGEQLVLSLDDVRLQRVVVPWDGRSPRVLTKAYARYILKAQGGGREVDPRQFEMFEMFGRVPVREKRAPGLLTGAPSLRPLPKRY